MSDDSEKMLQRMTGVMLQVAARLIETPGSGALLYRVATKQLGIEALRALRVPEHTPPYRPTHLGGQSARPIVLAAPADVRAASADEEGEVQR